MSFQGIYAEESLGFYNPSVTYGDTFLAGDGRPLVATRHSPNRGDLYTREAGRFFALLRMTFAFCNIKFIFQIAFTGCPAVF